jgi:hypothetical protein
VDWIRLAQVVDPCQCGNEPQGLYKGRDFLTS